MEILFISDYVCPYCLVAKEGLHQALQALELEANITWQPFELTQEPRPRVDTWHDEVRRAKYQILVEPCRQLGLDMKLPPNVVPRPYTRLAFEGWHYACEHGAGDAYNDLMYRAYFTRELDIGRIEVLAQLAAEVGLDADDFADALRCGKYTQRQQETAARIRETLKPRGVPTIYIDSRPITLSDYTRREWMQILSDAAFQAEGGMFCGPDGC